ncbi:hypothetical protein RCOM_1590990 [Ricinus communis]|uniref:BRI1 kinase inhibitor 1 n=1 Tax=Ricinus communis TaxID=3988 RepID=B9R7E8_RICCO|nr:hypothetical protein RCOM_1590990 [Ricinus communis]
METKQHSNIKEKVVYKHEEEKLKKEGKEDIIPAATKQQQQVPYTSSPVATTSPPSASSSPSHEFSFTISLHSSSAPVPDGCEVRDKEDKDKQKKKLRFEVSQVLKRYVRMVRPLLFFKGRREKLQFHRQPYSFSGNLSWKNKQELRGRRGEYSAPASMRTSPTNSGLLVATASIPSSTSDSTMEELQAAIQAAIAHCKNSIAAEEKIKC